MIPALANVYLPILASVLSALWPGMPDRASVAGQVEQETCPSLKSPMCWNPLAELKTAREFGFGLGQLTITAKFNNFVAARGWDKSLADWQWEDHDNPAMQLRALVAYDRNLFSQIRFGETPSDKLSFMFSAYNGGLGGVLKDRVMCKAAIGCNPDKWDENVELYSFRSRTAVKGYGQSAYDINRGYVKNIRVRKMKYEGLL